MYTFMLETIKKHHCLAKQFNSRTPLFGETIQFKNTIVWRKRVFLKNHLSVFQYVWNSGFEHGRMIYTKHHSHPRTYPFPLETHVWWLWRNAPSNKPMCYISRGTYLHLSRITTARIPPNIIMALTGDFWLACFSGHFYGSLGSMHTWLRFNQIRCLLSLSVWFYIVVLSLFMPNTILGAKWRMDWLKAPEISRWIGVSPFSATMLIVKILVKTRCQSFV